MITAVLFIIASLAFGIVLSKKISEDNHLIYALPLSVLFGTWLVFIFSLAIGFNQVSITLAALALAIAALILHKFWKKQETKLLSQEIIPLFLAALVVFTVFAWVLFHYDSQGNLAGIRTDFGFHHAQVSSLAAGNFPPEHPFYANHQLVYYYFTHLYSASLVVGGLPLQEACWLPLILLNTSIVCLLFLLVKKWFPKESKTNFLPYLAIFLFLFNGTFAFLPWIEKNQITLSIIPEILQNPKFYPTFREMFPFENIFTTQLLTSFAVPVAISLIIIALASLKEKRSLVLLGLLPMFHFFAFAVLVLFLLTYVLFFDRKREWLKIFAAIGVLALPQVLFFTQKTGDALNSFYVRFGWMSPKQDLASIVWFWLANLGPYLILGALGWYLIKNKEVRNIALATLPAFFIANLFIFTPYVWDSIKFFSLFFLVLAMLAAFALKRIFEIPLFGKPIFLGIIILMTLTGILSTWTVAAHANDIIYPKTDIEMCEWTNQNIPKNSLFLTNGEQSCLFSTEGQRVFMGYEEWIRTHGYNYTTQLEENNRMLAGDCRLILRNKIDYLFIGGPITRNSEVNQTFLETKTEKIYDKNGNQIYEIKC